MKPRDWFGVMVRFVGVLALLGAVLYFQSALVAWIDPKRPNIAPAWHYGLECFILLLTSLYLMRGAPHLIRFAYGEEFPNQ